MHRDTSAISGASSPGINILARHKRPQERHMQAEKPPSRSHSRTLRAATSSPGKIFGDGNVARDPPNFAAMVSHGRRPNRPMQRLVAVVAVDDGQQRCSSLLPCKTCTYIVYTTIAMCKTPPTAIGRSKRYARVALLPKCGDAQFPALCCHRRVYRHPCVSSARRSRPHSRCLIDRRCEEWSTRQTSPGEPVEVGNRRHVIQHHQNASTLEHARIASFFFLEVTRSRKWQYSISSSRTYLQIRDIASCRTLRTGPMGRKA
ncbi:hypothetical protein FPV67DRAFT_1140667 [Lyophyllum atratum]|nr:hypothetical protein FPV67DRAFT_1140667 [Lyophyllum atratum]